MPLKYNYGGILQAFALQTVLERMGNEVFVVRKSNYVQEKTFWSSPLIILIRFIKKSIKRIIGRKHVVFYEKEANNEFRYLTQNTWPFVEKYIKTVYTKDWFLVPKNDFDCLIVGSDQVWRKEFIENYGIPVSRLFLDYAKDWNVIRISYAASFGIDSWDYSKEETKKCRDLVNMFNAISVREESGISLCKNNLGVDAQCVLDPTMLLNINDYINLINKAQIESLDEGYVVSYLLDPSGEKNLVYDHIVDFYQSPRYIMVGNPWSIKNISERQLPAIEQWLNAFWKSKFVFTDSFHGTVFSIIFNRPFIVFRNSYRGNARIESLLHLFGLENRLVDSVGECDKILSTPIAWNEVNAQLEIMRKNSMLFLSKNIS